MEFAEIIPNVTQSVFSPCGTLLALTNGSKLIIKNISSGKILQFFTFIDEVFKLEFSPNSKYVLALMKNEKV